MRLKQSALGAVTGIVYLFLSRIAGTFWPQLFYNSSAARANAALSFLAAGALLLFYLMMYRHFTLPNKKGEQIKNERLNNASLFAATGHFFVLLFFTGGLIRVFGMEHFLSEKTQETITVYFLLAGAIGWVYFAGVFFEETKGKISERLFSAAKLAVWGSSMGLLLRIYLMLRLYYPSQFRWNGSLNSGPLFLLIPMMLFVFFTAVNFLWAFSREN